MQEIIDQLFVLGFRGSSVEDSSEIKELLFRSHLGGVILFDRFLASKSTSHNIISPSQVQSLCHALRQSASAPLLIAIDQEGGSVCRLKPKQGFIEIPSAASMGKDRSLASSRRYARQTGKLLRELGIDIDFAPVADLACNPENPVIARLGRAFSSSADEVTAHCRAWLEELKRAGVLGCLKHFPGHGSSSLDSHHHFVDISKTWSQDELLPYRQLIREEKVHLIMTGHLYNAGLDQEWPATLSQATIEGLLRRELGYDGLVITDDMQMQAIVSRFGLAEACVLALKAGADMVIVGNNLQYDPNILETLRERILRALDAKELSEQRLRQAHARVQQLHQILMNS